MFTRQQLALRPFDAVTLPRFGTPIGVVTAEDGSSLVLGSRGLLVWRANGEVTVIDYASLVVKWPTLPDWMRMSQTNAGTLFLGQGTDMIELRFPAHVVSALVTSFRAIPDFDVTDS